MNTKRMLSLLLALITVLGLAVSVSSAEASPYKDVKTSRWSYADIMYVTENGLMNGTSADKFAPAETMTRAMVVTVLHRLQGAPKMDYKKTFSDVKGDKWYTDAILWAAEKEIVNGVGDGKFDPMGTITREQLATIIMRYAPKEYIITEERADITGYADYKKVRDYAKDALSWANAIGLITGKTESTLAPREGATREQFAKILRCFKEYDSYRYELVYNAPTYNEYVKPTYDLVTDADIYVSTTGNDNNDGSFAKPVKTFERARDMVRAMDKTGRNGITVAFMAGEYGYLNNLTFTAEDAGTEACPITYTAYGDGDVIFRNGVEIPEESYTSITEEEKAMFPEKAVDFIKKVDLAGKIDDMKAGNYLFTSNGVAWEARYPNRNQDGSDAYFKDFTTRVEEEGKKEEELDKLQLQALVLNTVNKFKVTEGMKVTGYLRAGWLVDTFATKSYDKTTGILTLDYENSAFENGYPMISGGVPFPLGTEDKPWDDTIFFHNLAELLDTDGEYWFDKNTKQLYVYAPVGDYAIGNAGTFMTIDANAKYITFRGLEFNTNTATAVYCEAHHTTFEGCTFGNIGGAYAIHLPRIMYATVNECEFYNFVDTGIMIENKYIGEGKGYNRDYLIDGHNVFTNNYFHDFSLPEYWGVGIDINHDCGTYVAHNVFYNGVNGAINFYSTIDVVIEYNVFDRMMTNTKDGGAVDTGSCPGYRDNIIRYNIFSNMELGPTGERYGIYLDDFTSGQHVYGNIFYNNGGHAVTMNRGRDNEVHDNILIGTDKMKGDLLMINPGMYELILNGTPELYEGYQFWTLVMGQRVPEDHPMYDTWLERWPILYQYHADWTKVGDVECAFTTINYIRRNVSIGQTIEYSETVLNCGLIENNVELGLDENPYFADPTHGDYTIVSGKEQFVDMYDFSKIGFYK